MAPGGEAVPSQRGAVLSVVMEPVNGTYGFPTNQHFCPPPPISADSAHMHLGSTLAYCALTSSLYSGKSTIMHFHILTVGFVVDLYSRFLLWIEAVSCSCQFVSVLLKNVSQALGCSVCWCK